MELLNTQIKGEEEGKKTLWSETWGSLKKGIFGSMAAVVFGSVILIASIFAAANPLKVVPYSGETMMKKEVAEPTAALMMVDEKTATETPQMKVEYYLPYPGMLPDSKLYFVKALRDRVKLLVTFSREKQIETKLLYADKRINAAVFLMDGGKQDLAVSTATKAEKYLEQAINEAIELSKEQDVKSVMLQLSKSSAKHYEILATMQTKADSAYQEVLSKTKETTMSNKQKIDQALIESN